MKRTNTKQLISLSLHPKSPENDVADKTKKYLILNEINNLTTDAVKLNSRSAFELFSFDYEFEESYKCNLIFLTGFGEPSLTIGLNCNSIEIES